MRGGCEVRGSPVDGEPVHDGDDTVHPLGESDERPGLDLFPDAAFEGHHAAQHMDVDRVGVQTHGIHQDVLLNTASYLRVRAEEDTEQITAGHDAHQPFFLVDDGHTADVVLRRQPCPAGPA